MTLVLNRPRDAFSTRPIGEGPAYGGRRPCSEFSLDVSAGNGFGDVDQPTMNAPQASNTTTSGTIPHLVDRSNSSRPDDTAKQYDMTRRRLASDLQFAAEKKQ